MFATPFTTIAPHLHIPYAEACTARLLASTELSNPITLASLYTTSLHLRGQACEMHGAEFAR